MKKVFSRKTLVNTFLLFIGIMFFATDSFANCQYNDKVNKLKAKIDQYEGIEYTISRNAIVSTEDIHLAEEWDFGRFDTKGHGDPVWFGGAAAYYLPNNIKHYHKYRKLLEWNRKSKYNILKFTIWHNMYNKKIWAIPIINIEIPDEKTFKKIEEHYKKNHPGVTRPFDNIIDISKIRRKIYKNWLSLCAKTSFCQYISCQILNDTCRY